MHQFTVAARSCPERIYVRYLREFILESAIEAGKMDLVIESVERFYGVHIVEELMNGDWIRDLLLAGESQGIF